MIGGSARNFLTKPKVTVLLVQLSIQSSSLQSSISSCMFICSRHCLVPSQPVLPVLVERIDTTHRMLPSTRITGRPLPLSQWLFFQPVWCSFSWWRSSSTFRHVEIASLPFNRPTKIRTKSAVHALSTGKCSFSCLSPWSSSSSPHFPWPCSDSPCQHWVSSSPSPSVFSWPLCSA